MTDESDDDNTPTVPPVRLVGADGDTASGPEDAAEPVPMRLSERGVVSLLKIACSSCGYEALAFSTLGVAVDSRRCGCGGVLTLTWGRGRLTWVADP